VVFCAAIVVLKFDLAGAAALWYFEVDWQLQMEHIAPGYHARWRRSLASLNRQESHSLDASQNIRDRVDVFKIGGSRQCFARKYRVAPGGAIDT